MNRGGIGKGHLRRDFAISIADALENAVESDRKYTVGMIVSVSPDPDDSGDYWITLFNFTAR